MESVNNKYLIENSIVFKKNNEDYGYFSNMSSTFSLSVNDLKIPTIEALYQSLKFVDYIDIQKEILVQKSPMAIKYKARKYQKFIRKDWENIKIEVMEFCLRIKIYENPKFANLLLETRNMSIVENSNVDSFWGAKFVENYLIGDNQLGELLMKLRDELLNNKFEMAIPSHLELKIFGKEIYSLEKSIIEYEQMTIL